MVLPGNTFGNALGEIRGRAPGMMLLIALAITVAFVSSLGASAGLLDHQLDFWWESALLIAIMLLGLQIASKECTYRYFLPSLRYHSASRHRNHIAIRPTQYTPGGTCIPPSVYATVERSRPERSNRVPSPSLFALQ